VALAGLAGMISVLTMGILPSANPTEHTKEFGQGWTLFFSTLIGFPCLAAFVGGLTPWAIWFTRLRKRKKESSAQQ
jgi:hypothetical protein